MDTSPSSYVQVPPPPHFFLFWQEKVNLNTFLVIPPPPPKKKKLLSRTYSSFQDISISQRGHYISTFIFPDFSLTSPDVKEFSITFWHNILVETVIIKLNLRNGKTLRQDNLSKLSDVSLTFLFLSQIPWLSLTISIIFHFPDISLSSKTATTL